MGVVCMAEKGLIFGAIRVRVHGHSGAMAHRRRIRSMHSYNRYSSAQAIDIKWRRLPTEVSVMAIDAVVVTESVVFGIPLCVLPKDS